MRRYVAETSYNLRGDSLQVVTVYPAALNKKQVEKDIGRLTARKAVLIKQKEKWRYEEL